MAQKREWVFLRGLNTRQENFLPHIVVQSSGPNGGQRSAQSITVEQAERLIADLQQAIQKVKQ